MSRHFSHAHSNLFKPIKVPFFFIGIITLRTFMSLRADWIVFFGWRFLPLRILDHQCCFFLELRSPEVLIKSHLSFQFFKRESWELVDFLARFWGGLFLLLVLENFMDTIKIGRNFHQLNTFYFSFHAGIVIFPKIQLKNVVVECADFLYDFFQFSNLILLYDCLNQVLFFFIWNVHPINSNLFFGQNIDLSSDGRFKDWIAHFEIEIDHFYKENYNLQIFFLKVSQHSVDILANFKQALERIYQLPHLLILQIFYPHILTKLSVAHHLLYICCVWQDDVVIKEFFLGLKLVRNLTFRGD